jgi:hypothetical protein
MICNNNLTKKLLQSKHFCDWSINSLQQATQKFSQELEGASCLRNLLQGHYKSWSLNDQLSLEYLVKGNAQTCECWHTVVPLSPIVHSGANRYGSKLQTGCVNKVFWEHWIDHVSPVLPVPLDWPLQTPDLSLCDFPCGLCKGDCYTAAYKLLKTFNRQWDLTFKHVNPHMLQKSPTDHVAELFSVMRMMEHT